LRYAILDSARVGNKIKHERHQMDRNTAEGWKRMLATLLHTPLSAAQRGLLTEITGALDAWKAAHTNGSNGAEFAIEPPDLIQSNFNCREVIESALDAVRKNAAETGANVQAALVGSAPESMRGSAAHIHQLISMLALSLPTVASAETLELQISFESERYGATMQLAFRISSKNDEATVHSRLSKLTEDSTSLRGTAHGEAELTFKAACQLATALSASQSVDTTAEGKIRVHISIPQSTGPTRASGNGAGLDLFESMEKSA
jgi:hypothetical protein